MLYSIFYIVIAVFEDGEFWLNCIYYELSLEVRLESKVCYPMALLELWY